MKRFSLLSVFVTLVGACLFIPLFFHPELRGPFQTMQIVSFYFLIELALPFFLFLLFSKPSLRPDWKNPILLSLFAFLLATTLSAFFGVDLFNSFLGNAQRMDSILFLWHLFLFLLYLIAINKSGVRAQQIMIRIFLIVAGVCGFIGLLQVLHLLPDVWKMNDTRASSTIGNPIFFAATLIIPFFLAVGALIKEKNLAWKKIFGAVVLTTGLGILASGTRGAMVGIGAGFFVLGITYLKTKRTVLLSRKSLIVMGLLAVVLIAGMFLLRTISKPESNLYRVTHLSDSNVSNRLAYWGMALRGWRDAPWLGVGYENFFAVADRYYSSDLYSSGGTWPDKPHNQYLETLVTGGIVSFLCFLVFIFFLIKSMVRDKRNDSEIQNNLLLSALVAYLVQNIFSFDTITPLISFFVLVSIITSNKTIAQEKPNDQLSRYQPVAWLGFMLPMIIFPLLFVPIVTQFHLTDRADKAPSPEKAFLFLETIKQQSYVYDLGMLTRSYYALFRGGKLSQTKNITSEQISESALEIAKKNVERSPLRANNWYIYSILITQYARDTNIMVPEEGFTSAYRAVNLAPARMEALVSLATMYQVNGNNQMAMEISQKAVSIAPNNKDALWLLGALYLENNETDKAAPTALSALKNHVILRDSDSLGWIINYYVAKNDSSTVVYLYEKAIEFDPNKLDLLPKLAAAYAMNGQMEKAILTAQLLLKKDPASKPAVEAFIKSIQKK